MNKTTLRLHQLLTNQQLNNYWPSFQITAFALFNEHDVTLFNHPLCKNESFIKIAKTEQFNACTVILYENYPTAIVDERLFQRFENLYAILVHELFHGYQYLYEESRFPNEMIGLNYTLTVQNISLRIEEHKALILATKTQELQYINHFIAIRKSRMQQFPEEVSYETAIESVEGPAYYVEYRAFKSLAESEQRDYLEKSLALLDNPLKANLQIRKSCYSSGLALCLLLDNCSKNWKQPYTQSTLSLFDYLLTYFPNVPTLKNEFPNHRQQAEEIIQQELYCKDVQFEQFHRSPGNKVVIQGNIQLLMFDPMNIIKSSNKALHKNFLQFSLEDTQYTITEATYTEFSQNFRIIHRLEFFIPTEPLFENQKFIIGYLHFSKGHLEKVDGVYYFTI